MRAVNKYNLRLENDFPLEFMLENYFWTFLLINIIFSLFLTIFA